MTPSEHLICSVATKWQTNMPEPSHLDYLIGFVADELGLSSERVKEVLLLHDHPMAILLRDNSFRV